MGRTMRAAWIENGRVGLRELPRPRPRKGEALIRVHCAGICNTDLELLAGYYGFRGVPGHEFVGTVIEGSPRWLGRRVVGGINLGCGRCPQCAAGMRRHCPRRRVLGILNHPGALAEFLTLPEENLFQIPRSVPDEDAVFCEPLAAACEILEQVRIPRAAPVAVLGDGKLGLLCAQALAAAGAQVTLFGRHPERSKWLASRRIRLLCGTRRPARAFPFVVEASGSASGLEEALQLVAPRGAVILKSTTHEPVLADLAKLVVVPEVTLVGSRCGPFPMALRLLRQHRVETAPLVHSRMNLADVAEAFRLAAAPGALKVLVECQTPSSSTAQ
jgi:alcohol dehydrogenase